MTTIEIIDELLQYYADPLSTEGDPENVRAAINGSLLRIKVSLLSKGGER